MLTKEDISKYIYDPNSIQNYVLDSIEQTLTEPIDIVDPTNPFTMLLEASVVTPSSAVIETQNGMRRMYPNLSVSKEDLYPHLTDDVVANMFAVPSEANIVFYINILDLKQNGYRPIDADYVEMVLPEFTEVTVVNTTFTLLNDINVRLYDNGSIFIEQQISPNDIGINDISILNGVITTGADGDSWILFETKVKQVKRIVHNDTVMASEGYSVNIALTDQYFYIDVMYKNADTNNEYVQLKRLHDDAYIDPYTPTAIIKEIDGGVNVTIPDVYLYSGLVSGNIEIVVYETKGKLYLPINNYVLEDYNLVLGNTGKTTASAVSPNITILANSRYVVDGGADSLSFEDMREAVIYNSTGDIDLPITDYQLKRKATFNGFELFKAMDVITNRTFIASKNTTAFQTNAVNARADIFNNTTRVILADLVTNNNVYIDDDIFIIKSGTLFKEDNGVVTILDNNEVAYINSLDSLGKTTYFKDKRIFYTPFYYILDKISDIVTSRVYDLDNPVMENIRILDKNVNIKQRVNIDKYLLEKVDTGYKITILPILDSNFSDIDLNSLKMQLRLSIVDSEEYVYFQGSYDTVTGYIVFNIDTNFYINEKGYLPLSNGVSNISNRVIDIHSEAIFHFYLENTNIVDELQFLRNEVSINSDIVVLTKERADLTLGNELKYLWNKIHNEYSERLYLKYTEDVPLLYDKDIYEENPETGAIFDVVETEDGKTLVYNKIHSEGDPVLDADGNPVYKYKTGDIVIGEDGLPVIDQMNGIIRYIDILMIEAEYKVANTLIHKNYLELLMDTIKNWLLVEMQDLNNDTLENTIILFKSYKSSLPIKVNVNNVTYSTNYSISPNVTLYSIRNDYSLEEISAMKVTVGNIVHDQLDTVEIKLSEIKDKIIAALGNDIVGVKITGLDSIGDLEVFTINDKATRLVMNKHLVVNPNNELIVEYDLTLNIQKV